MKKLLLILFLTLSISAIGQRKYSYKRGLKFLSKSEELCKNNEFEKSLFFLNKYEKSVLGHCGSAVIIAQRDIYDLKIKNYIGLKKFDDALTLIDKSEPIFSEEIQFDDSLKVEILFLKFGKDKVINSFNNVDKIESKSSELGNFIYNIYLKELNYTFKFRKEENTESKLEYNSSQYEINKLLKDSTIFNLIF